MKKKLLTTFCLLLTGLLSAQTFTNSVGGAITDNNVYTNFTITVSGLPTQLNTSTFGLEWVNINIVHPNVGDLRIKLTAPNGNVFYLTSFNGGTGDNYTNTTFSDTASVNISAGVAPFNGVYHPLDPLANFNNTMNPNGTWTLQVRDATTGNIGSLTNWSLHFGSQPAGGLTFTSSNLPIVVINTGGVTIPDEPKIRAWMGIIYNGPGVRNYMNNPFNNYRDSIGIETRGSSSAGFPQKQYGIETRNNAGLPLDTTVLGMPAEHDWVLYAPYDDKTCIRNVLTYDIANKTGHYASRTKLCEVVLNGQYQGIYVWMEKVKRDSNRCDVAKLDSNDVAGDSLTGGYIIKVDKLTGNGGDGWYSNYLSPVSNHTIYFQYHYPSELDILPAQKTYLQNYVDSFETALNGPNFQDPVNGFRKYASQGSFIDYFLLNEISKNVDGYRLSSYLHKDKYSKGGKLKAGPAWDFNLAWWNANYCNGNVTTGWEYNFNSVCSSDGFQNPFWWSKLLQDTMYVKALRCRWNELRQTTLSITTLNNYIDSLAAYLQEAQVRHFTKWPIIGVYTWPNPTPIPTSYAGEITALKSWIQSRVTWMDANLPGTCVPSIADFYSNNLVVCAGDSIKFHDNSSLYPTSWSWSFPGGSPSSSTLQNPKILYPTAGTYNVTLTATNIAGSGAPVTFTSYITVNPLPVVTAPANVNACVGSPVAASSFTSSVIGTTFQWTNSDTTIGLATSGTGDFSSFNAINTTGTPVSSTVTVTPTANGCLGNPITYTITVNPLPSVSVDSTTICEGTTASLTANGGTSYTWSAGATPTGVNTADVSPLTTTTYTVTGTTAGCSTTAVSTINVQSAINVTVNSPTICSGQTTGLTAGGATSFSWSAGATTTGTNTADVSPSVTTTYTVTGTDAACTATAAATVTVDPAVSVSINSPSICTGETANLVANGATSYTWSSGVNITGNNSADVSPTITTTYTVTGTAGTCSDSAFATVTVVPSLTVIVNSVTICEGNTANLTANGANVYIWSAGATSVGVNTADANPITTSTYTVTGSSGNCSATAVSTVTVLPPLTVSVNSVTICAGDTANLAANGATAYTWSAGATSVGANTADATPLATSTYTVTGSSGTCTGTALSTVTVDTIPAIPTISTAGNVLISSSTTGNQWYFNGAIILGANSQYYTAFANGTYTVIVSNGNCSSAESNPELYYSVGIASTSGSDNTVSIYPNPFSDNFSLSFYLKDAEQIKIEVTDVLGRNIKTLEEREFAEGNNTLEINFTSGELKEGIYFLKMISAKGTIVEKIVKMK